MIPRTFPSVFDSAGRTQMVVHLLESATGLTKWVDYIPVRQQTASVGIRGRYDANGFISAVKLNSIVGRLPFVDYIPAFIDNTATKPWSTDVGGYIPLNGGDGLHLVIAQFAGGAQGLWIDPSDFKTLAQDVAGYTAVTAVGQFAALAMDRRQSPSFVKAAGLTYTRTAGDGALSVSGNVVTITAAVTQTTVVIGSDTPSNTPGVARMTITADYMVATGVQALLRGVATPLTAGAATILSTALNNSTVDRLDISTGTASFTITDFSYSKGNHLSQKVAGSRAVLKVSGTFPHFLNFDGVDDSLATGVVALGTNMDVFIAVRRASASNALLLSADTSGTKFLAAAAAGSTVAADPAGTATYAVNGVNLNGGAPPTQGQLHDATPIGLWQVVEVRNINLSTWAKLFVGGYTNFMLNGDIGGIIICPAGDADARANNRDYLSSKVGLTLP